MASLGCKVVMTGRNMERLQMARDVCKKAGAKEDHVRTLSILHDSHKCYLGMYTVLNISDHFGIIKLILVSYKNDR